MSAAERPEQGKMYCPHCRQNTVYCKTCGKEFPANQAKRFKPPKGPLYDALANRSVVVEISQGVARRVVLLDDIESILSMTEITETHEEMKVST